MAVAGRRCCGCCHRMAGLLLAVSVLLLAGAQLAESSCSGTTTTASLIGDAELAVKIGQMLPGAHRRISAADLPAARPPPPAGGWAMCDWDCASSVEVKSSERGETRGGAFTVDVTFKPLKGVTADAMVWLLRNLHRDAVSPLDGRSYPMYLLFHGVDHLHHEATPADDVRVGTVFTWCEMPLTGCTYNRSSAAEPWTCPRERGRGFVAGDPASAWANRFHTRVNMTVTRFDRGSIEFVSRETNPFFGPPGTDAATRVVATTRHTWSDSPDGLRLRSQQWVGLMAPGSNTEFDTSPIAPVTNLIIKNEYLDAAANLPKNITAAAYGGALHFLQEYGSLSTWLPDLYAGRTQG
ncbi:hypothetical protein HT031_005995 [Scenedesmus sp. PABB004]|nr:hypothetical protein HT031_005995 [Scenedesmus sp. PABB004]